MSKWYPIETAPKDGTEILVYAGGRGLQPVGQEGRQEAGYREAPQVSESPDYSQADMDNRIKAMVLRLQAKALREHANSLGSAAVDHALPRHIKGKYKFASDRAHDEANALEEGAKGLERALVEVRKVQRNLDEAVYRLERENAELRARIARLESCISAPPRGFCEGLGELSTRLDWLAKAHDIREESPRQSLAHIKAETLREAAQRAPCDAFHVWLREEAVLVEAGRERYGVEGDEAEFMEAATEWAAKCADAMLAERTKRTEES